MAGEVSNQVKQLLKNDDSAVKLCVQGLYFPLFFLLLLVISLLLIIIIIFGAFASVFLSEAKRRHQNTV